MTASLELLIKARDEASAVLDNIEGKSSKLGGVMSGALKVGALGAAAGIGVLTAAAAVGLGSLIEHERLDAQTGAVLKSTGNAAGVTAKEISALADAVEKKSGMDDAAIQNGQNLLLTFTNIQNKAGEGNDIFNQTTEIMADMATALGTDASGSAIQLGKALNDPIKGVTALSKVGVSFTDEQREQIRVLQESGDVMGAQKVILAELSKEFGGSAEAAGKTFSGQLNILKATFEDLAAGIMSKALPVMTSFVTLIREKGMPIVQKLADVIGVQVAGAIEAVRPFIEGFIAAWNDPDVTSDGLFGAGERAAVMIRTQLIPALEAIVGFVKTDVVPQLADFAKILLDIGQVALTQFLLPALKNLKKDWDALWPVLQEHVIPLLEKVGQFLLDHKPILIAVAALVLLMVAPWLAVAAAIVIVLAKQEEIAAFFESVVEHVQEMIEKVSEVPIIGEIFQSAFDSVIAIVTAAFESVKVIVDTQIKVVRDIINIVLALIHGDFGQAWDNVKLLFEHAFEGLKALVGIQLGLIKDLIWIQVQMWVGVISDSAMLFYDVGVKVLVGLKNGMIAMLGALLVWVTGLPAEIVSWIPNPLDILKNIGSQIINGLWEGMKSKWESVKGWLGGLGGVIKSLKGPPEKDAVLLLESGRLVMQGFHLGMIETWSDALRWLRMLGPGIAEAAVPMIAAMQAAGMSLQSAFNSIFGQQLTDTATSQGAAAGAGIVTGFTGGVHAAWAAAKAGNMALANEILHLFMNPGSGSPGGAPATGSGSSSGGAAGGAPTSGSPQRPAGGWTEGLTQASDGTWWDAIDESDQLKAHGGPMKPIDYSSAPIAGGSEKARTLRVMDWVKAGSFSGLIGNFVSDITSHYANWRKFVSASQLSDAVMSPFREALVKRYGLPQLFDNGGWLMPGLSFVENRTNRPERVISNASDFGGVHFHGPVTIVANNPEDLYRRLRESRGR